MNLLLDVGNTAIKIAYSDGERFTFLTRFYTKVYNESAFKDILIEVKNIDNVFISSVIPEINGKLDKAVEEVLGLKPIYVDTSIDTDVNIDIDDKKELGADLYCDLVAAKKYYGNNVAIIDLGTASKILFLDDKDSFNCCAIFLGYMESIKSLASSTAMLPEVDPKKIKKISDCHNTIDVLQASTYYSQLDTIDGVIKRYEKEKNCTLKRIFTGGNAANFIKKSDIHDEYLTLKGLAILGERKLHHEKN